MQQFDPKLYPNLHALDLKVKTMLENPESKKWDSGEKMWRIARLHPVFWMEEYGYVRPGEVKVGGDDFGTAPVRFTLKPEQLQLADKVCGHVVAENFTRIQQLVLKHRKAGISTLYAAFDYWFMRFYENFNIMVIADLASHTDNIVEMIKLFHDRDTCGEDSSHKQHWVPKTVSMPKNKKGLKLSNGSMLEQDTGENDNPGTSGTLNLIHMCIDPDTPVIVRDGFLVKARDTLGKKIVSHNIRPGHVVNIHPAQSQEGWEFKIFGNPVPLRVTKDHRLFAREGRSGSWVKADDIATRKSSHHKTWYVGYPIRGFWSHNTERVIEKGVLTKQRKHGGGHTHDKMPKTFPLTFAMGRIVGLYLAEGSIGMAYKKYPSVLDLACHKKEVDLFASWVDQVGIPNKKVLLDGQRAGVVINSSYWARIFKRFFGKTRKKRIPDWTWTTNEDYMKGLILGYLTGDGHCCEDNASVMVSSIYPQLLVQIREMMLTLGWGYASMYRRDAGYWYGRNCKEIWTLGLFGQTGEMARKLLNVPFRTDRKTNHKRWDMYHSGDHNRIWLPIVSKKPCFIENPIDLEVDHPLHSYMLMGCASHNSENAKWRNPEDAETSLMNSMPRTGFACIFKESTAFGMNKFQDDCEKAWSGKSSWEFIFLTWLDMPDCCDDIYVGEDIQYTTAEMEIMAAYPKMRPGHIKFRRRQVELLGSEEKFRQDFPLNAREPFLVSGSNFFNLQGIRDRIDHITFFRDWKKHGIESISHRYPELMIRFKMHPRGMTEALKNLEDNCVVPKMVKFTDNDGAASWIPEENGRKEDGCVEMYKEPNSARKYLVTIDGAEGKKSSEYTSDNSVIEVFDAMSMEQVAEWAGCFDEEMTASMAVMIAGVYNNALIAAEMNNSCGGTLIQEIKKTGYDYLYHRETIVNNKVKKELGWHTKAGLKKDICAQMRLDFKNQNVLIHSLELLEEMMYFMEKGPKLEAADGKHDDRVMCTAISLKIINVTPSMRLVVEKKEYLPESMFDSFVPSGIRPSKQLALERYM